MSSNTNRKLAANMVGLIKGMFTTAAEQNPGIQSFFDQPGTANLDLEDFAAQCVTRGDAFGAAAINIGYGLLQHYATKKPEIALPAKDAMTVNNLFAYLAKVRESDIEMQERDSLFNVFQPIAVAVGGAIINGLMSGNKQPVILYMQAPGQVGPQVNQPMGPPQVTGNPGTWTAPALSPGGGNPTVFAPPNRARMSLSQLLT